MKLGALLMPSHPPERSIGDGQRLDLEEIERLDALGFEEAWIGEHFTARWEPCPAPDLLIAQALARTERIRLGPLGHLLPYHHPVELAHRVAYLDHLAHGRYRLGVGISALPSDHQLFGLETQGGVNRRMTFEALEIMTRLWTEGPCDFKGEFWSMGVPRTPLDSLGYHLRPYQSPHPPIAIAGLTPGSTNHKLAGEKGQLEPGGIPFHARVFDGGQRAGQFERKIFLGPSFIIDRLDLVQGGPEIPDGFDHQLGIAAGGEFGFFEEAEAAGEVLDDFLATGLKFALAPAQFLKAGAFAFEFLLRALEFHQLLLRGHDLAVHVIPRGRARCKR